MIPVHARLWPLIDGVRHDPFEVYSYVEWCGHQQEIILTPRDDRWWGEIPVVSEAS